jgi:hypothetical protein
MVVEHMGGGSPNIFVVMYALSRYHDDAVLLEKVLTVQSGVVPDLFDVDDGTMVAKGLVEHSHKRRTTIFDSAQMNNLDVVGGGAVSDQA